MTIPSPRSKLASRPEGRPDLYLVEAADVIAWLNERSAGQHTSTNADGSEEAEWHCYIPTGPIMTGADWSHSSVIDLLREPQVRLAINLDAKDCMLHQLAVAHDARERLFVFDVGVVTIEDLEVVQ